MKKYILIIAALFITGGTVWAQEAEEAAKAKSAKPDTTRLRIGKKKVIIINDDLISIESDSTEYDYEWDWDDSTHTSHNYKKTFEAHWSGIDIGLNNVLNSGNTLDMPQGAEYLDIHMGNSWGVGLNVFDKGFNIYNDQVGIVTGLGFEFNNYRFTKNISLVPDLDSLAYTSDSISYSKNKLTCTYLTIPLLIEAHIPIGGNDLRIAVGGIAGVKIGSHTKQVYYENGNKIKSKSKGDYHLNPFRYGVTARLGYSGINLYAIYNFSTLFEEDEGPTDLYPFSIGFSVVF